MAICCRSNLSPFGVFDRFLSFLALRLLYDFLEPPLLSLLTLFALLVLIVLLFTADFDRLLLLLFDLILLGGSYSSFSPWPFYLRMNLTLLVDFLALLPVSPRSIRCTSGEASVLSLKQISTTWGTLIIYDEVLFADTCYWSIRFVMTVSTECLLLCGIWLW